MDEEARKYYLNNWGFDPITDRIDIKNDWNAPVIGTYYFQAVIPLENDPELVERGVKMYARVYVDNNGNAHNRIVFEGKNSTSFVECAHTIVYRAPVEELKTLTEEDYIALVNKRDASLAELPPWEHFAALKSFVAGIAAVGLQYLEELNLNYQEPLPLVVGSNLLNHIICALMEIEPNLFKSSHRSQCEDILHRAPKNWIMERWEILQQKYDVTGLLINEEFLMSLDFPMRQKLTEIYLLLTESDMDTGWKEELAKFKREFFNVFLSDEFIKKSDRALLHRILEEMLRIEDCIKIARIFIYLFSVEDKQIGEPEFLRQVFLKINNPAGISVITGEHNKIEEIVRTTSAKSLRRFLRVMINRRDPQFFGEFTEIVIHESLKTRKRVLSNTDWKDLLASRNVVNVERKRGFDGKKHIPNLTSEELVYYRIMWGFDPVQDRAFPPLKPGEDSSVFYYYEAPIPLENDPDLKAKGIKIYVRVEADEKGNSHNRIIFKRGERHSMVRCVSNVFYYETRPSSIPFSDMDYATILDNPGIAPAPLLPWEHFTALKSFVSGLSVVGFRNLIHSFEKIPDDSLPIVGPSLMTEIISVLTDVDSSLIETITQQRLYEIFDRAPLRWILDRWKFLNIHSAVKNPFDDPNYLHSISLATRKKFLDIYFHFAREYMTNNWDYYLSHNGEKFLTALLTQDFINQLDLNKIELILGEIRRHVENKSMLEKLLESQRYQILKSHVPLAGNN